MSYMFVSHMIYLVFGNVLPIPKGMNLNYSDSTNNNNKNNNFFALGK